MTESFVPTPHTPAENRLSLLAAIFLGLAATLTAFSAYQAALEDGDSLTAFTESTAALGEANHLYGVANQVQVGDRQLFVEFATTAQDPDAPPRAAAYIRTLMRPEMVEALDWWLDNDESLTPFDDLPGNPYEVAELDQADVKAAAAKAAYDRAIENDEVGDRFDLATVLFALTLFFGGIATLFRRYAVSVGLLVVAALSLAAGSVQLTMALAA
ncbi:MAG: hypothetical protein H6529_13360 [Nocardioides sp.]|nr:hypothetical protein [Nocardioides sp.]